MMKFTTLLTVVLVASACAYPAASISRWFSSAFNDLKFTLHRYGHCYNGLQPLSLPNMNETEFLIHEIRSFLEEGNYDNEQLANVSALMDNICRPKDVGLETNYPVSMHIDLAIYGNNHTRGKENRCRAIDEAMDSMYYVFKRAALNHSEALDFSTILFYPNATDRQAFYNLTDLINTSWIKSEIILEHVCGITNATKEYIAMRSSNATAQARAESTQSVGVVGSFFDYIDRMLDRLLGIQKRLYWESSTQAAVFRSRVGSGLSSLRGGIGSGLSSTRRMIFGSRSNSTTSATTQPKANSTTATLPPTTGTSTTPAPVVRSTYSTSTSTSSSVRSTTSLPVTITSTSTSTTASPSGRPVSV